MKTILLGFFLILLTNYLYSQEIDTADIFTTNKKQQLILKPEIEKKINNRIESRVKEKLEHFKKMSQKDFENYDKDRIVDEYEFAKDTIQLNAFLNEYENSYSMATTTMGMNWKSSAFLQGYDKLLNKYYLKAQTVLKIEGKNKLISSQKKWLEYYNNEKKFISDLNDFGNHNSSLYCWSYYINMMESRVEFLKDIYNKNFYGTFIYKD